MNTVWLVKFTYDNGAEGVVSAHATFGAADEKIKLYRKVNELNDLKEISYRVAAYEVQS